MTEFFGTTVSPPHASLPPKGPQLTKQGPPHHPSPAHSLGTFRFDPTLFCSDATAHGIGVIGAMASPWPYQPARPFFDVRWWDVRTATDSGPKIMRTIITVVASLLLALGWESATAQNQPPAQSQPPQVGDSPHSTGRTVLPPEMRGVDQPQGPTGPLETKSGGAPASSPQGQTPPGMQAAPDGSDKTIVDPPKK